MYSPFLVLALAATAPAALTQESLLAEFAKSPGLSCHFREERRMALLVAPLVSEGTVDFAPPALLVRHVETPAPATLRVDGPYLEMVRGGKTDRLDLDANPAVRPFVDAFAGILRGDLAALRATFRVELAPGKTAGSWEMSLTPIKGPMAKVIRKITLAGTGGVLESLILSESSGDESVTTFDRVDAAHRHSPEDLRRLRGE